MDTHTCLPSRARIAGGVAAVTALPAIAFGAVLYETLRQPVAQWPPAGYGASLVVLIILVLLAPIATWGYLRWACQLSIGPAAIRVGRRVLRWGDIVRAEWDWRRQCVVLHRARGRPLYVPIELYDDPEAVTERLRVHLQSPVTLEPLGPRE